MPELDLIGVPFDGFGRVGHQAHAAGALRAAGLEHALGARRSERPEDLVLPSADPARSPGSGLMNETALLAMVDAVHRRVSRALAAGCFPIVYGAECSVLLGAVSGLRDTEGRAGLIFVDAHEDTTPLDVSPDGEAANMGARAPAGDHRSAHACAAAASPSRAGPGCRGGPWTARRRATPNPQPGKPRRPRNSPSSS